MGEVAVTIYGRDYHIGCQDGQEEHLIKLAAYLDGKVNELVGNVGNIGDMPLLAMAGILVADELTDSRADKSGDTDTKALVADALSGERRASVELLDAMARRIDNIAASLEDT
ncbi:MAG: cell division protein ZapA [Alphaproteobacteria bacterium]|nr:cell division protein ZapA [Alphaproteobacteria bacterium]MCZ6763935.1 cell division protein ZapA [Alphaproteobacteria bacterium]